MRIDQCGIGNLFAGLPKGSEAQCVSLGEAVRLHSLQGEHADKLAISSDANSPEVFDCAAVLRLRDVLNHWLEFGTLHN